MLLLQQRDRVHDPDHDGDGDIDHDPDLDHDHDNDPDHDHESDIDHDPDQIFTSENLLLFKIICQYSNY